MPGCLGHELDSIGTYQIGLIDAVNSLMIRWYEEHPPCLNYNTMIDDLTLKQQCEIEGDENGFNELYKCVSAQQLIAYFSDITYSINMSIASYGERMDHPTVLDFLHLCLSHLTPTLIKIDDQLILMANESLAHFKTEEVGYLIGEITIITLFMRVYMTILKKYYSCYEILISIMSHVSPINLISNKELMNRSSDGNTKSNLTICSIIQKLSYCILLVNISGIIEVVNPSVTILLGYTPEQLFGYMPVCEEYMTCIADNELKNPCVITILGKHGNSSTGIISFVMILRDESVLVQQQSDAEKAKKRSKSLLN